MSAAIRRFLPDEPLPPYTFVPGHSPHPVSDPAGHSFGQIHDSPTPLDPAHWSGNRSYLRGLDLFNHGFYWEAHEAWESLWHAAGRAGTSAAFIKGLIKLAASGVKHLEGKSEGVTSHASRAADLWRGVAYALDGQDDFVGLQTASLIALADSIALDGWPDVSPTLLPSEAP
jgi:hypothetical protein